MKTRVYPLAFLTALSLSAAPAPAAGAVLAPAVAATPAPSALATPGSPPLARQLTGHYHEGELGEAYFRIEQDLKCNCGCGLDVHSCQFQMQCGTSPVWSQRILRELQAGKTPEAIEAGFVAEFGPTVLMAPPPEGFNLVGYLLPGLAILTAGMLVGLIVRRGTGPATAPVAVEELSEEDRRRLEEELRRIEEAESPDW
ncbi:MAG: cytochrome c-type biogenesis protein CcmH [Gemmatimonadota bacterium]